MAQAPRPDDELGALRRHLDIALEHVGSSRELSLARTKLDEAFFWLRSHFDKHADVVEDARARSAPASGGGS